MPNETTGENEDMNLSKEEKAFLIKALWESLQAPAWTKDDLIEFGKAIFAKKSLKKMDDKTFVQILPFLEAVTVAFGKRLSEAQAAQAAAQEEAAANERNEEPEQAEKPEQPASEEAASK
jgi:hypothetical protein